jgi:hypothetical protein
MGKDGALACTTTTSGLAWKICWARGGLADHRRGPVLRPGRRQRRFARARGRSQTCSPAHSFHVVDLLRQGKAPLDAGMDPSCRRIVRQTQRQGPATSPTCSMRRGSRDFGLQFLRASASTAASPGVPQLKDPGQ